MLPEPSYEFRCPIHGFIRLNDWERQIISDPAFQRLRRIRQLAWTDEVYPGAMHTRFEHSLGVMHTATLLYEAVVRNSNDVLEKELGYNNDGLGRHKQLVRLAALLHDVGHAPFSHASEELFPKRPDEGTPYKHEHYSAAIVRGPLRRAIEDHPINTSNYGFRADDVAALIEGGAEAKQGLFWKDIISSQLDADRMDYLLRDPHHTGVGYGRFDLHRLISTVIAIPGGREKSPRFGIEEGGWHAAEALVVARYLMFTQVYFHKTRIAYDVHLRKAMKELLEGEFPPPDGEGLPRFLEWDDWRVLGLLSQGKGGEHGARLATRNHYREVYHTPEVCTQEDLEVLQAKKASLGNLLVAEESATSSWYKLGKPDIAVASKRDLHREGAVKPLSKHSKVIENMKSNNQILLYVEPENRDRALELLRGE